MRIVLLRLLCTCIQLISGFPSCCSLVYAPFADSGIIIHENTPEDNPLLLLAGISNFPADADGHRERICIYRFIKRSSGRI